MVEKTVNLTSILVTKEIQEFLAEYPLDNIYRIIFTMPYFQRRLITNILAKLDPHQIVMTDIKTLSSQGNFVLSLWEERLNLKNEVKQFIPELLIETYQELGQELIREKEVNSIESHQSLIMASPRN